MEQDKDEITVKEAYYEGGQLMHKEQYLNGDKHGEQLSYYSNGQLRHKCQYLNGKRHGEQLNYWDNGELSYKVYYINGKLVSYEEWVKYNRNLKLNSIWEKIKIK